MLQKSHRYVNESENYKAARYKKVSWPWSSEFHQSVFSLQVCEGHLFSILCFPQATGSNSFNSFKPFKFQLLRKGKEKHLKLLIFFLFEQHIKETPNIQAKKTSSRKVECLHAAHIVFSSSKLLTFYLATSTVKAHCNNSPKIERACWYYRDPSRLIHRLCTYYTTPSSPRTSCATPSGRRLE